jgi:hypothetical protein
MQNTQDQNHVVSQPYPKPFPQHFDDKAKPQKEQESQEHEANQEHDHGKSHSGL